MSFGQTGFLCHNAQMMKRTLLHELICMIRTYQKSFIPGNIFIFRKIFLRDLREQYATRRMTGNAFSDHCDPLQLNGWQNSLFNK